MMPPLRKYTFVPATGQIIARTVTGEETEEPTTTTASCGQGAQGQEAKAETAQAKAAQAKAAQTKATGSKTGAEAPQPDKPKGSLKVAGAEDEDAEDNGDDEEAGAEDEDCLEELAALTEMQGVAGGKRKPKAAGKTQAKKKAKAKAQ